MTNNNTSEVPNREPSNFNICARVYRESLLFSPKSSKKAPLKGPQTFGFILVLLERTKSWPSATAIKPYLMDSSFNTGLSAYLSPADGFN
jgi:hypothetical protein